MTRRRALSASDEIELRRLATDKIPLKQLAASFHIHYRTCLKIVHDRYKLRRRNAVGTVGCETPHAQGEVCEETKTVVRSC